MKTPDWIKSLPAAVTVCDQNGIIVEMNEKSEAVFAKDGGRDLLGTNVLDCHPEPARSKLKELLETQKVNCYTIEKNGIKKMIYQTPWYDNGEFGGLVEFSFEIPFELPHFIRQST